MSEERLFQDADEEERLYAPEQLPDEQRRVRADEGYDPTDPDEPPAPRLVASLGNVPSGVAASPNAGPGVEDDDDDDDDPSDRAHNPNAQ